MYIDIDRAIEALKGCTNETDRRIAEWLEELKRRREYDGEIIGSGALRNAYNQGYNKAIDDFVQLVKKYDWNIRNRNENAFIYGAIDKIAEQLKAGETSGTDNK